MKALILAAGLGTRLRPLTLKTPKPLLPIFGVPVIDRIIHRLKDHGIQELVINNHHLGNQIEERLGDGRAFGVRVRHSHEEKILGSGGAIGRAAALLMGDDCFLLHNSDVLSDINLSMVLEAHRATGKDVTMVLVDREQYNQVEVDSHGRVLNILRERPEAEEPNHRYLAYTGIAVIGTRLLPEFPVDREEDLIRIFLRLIQEGVRIGYLFIADCFWVDMGGLPAYFDLHQSLHARGRPSYVSPSARVSPATSLKGFYSIGDRAVINEGCSLENIIVVADSVMQSGTRLSNGIYDGGEVIYEKKWGNGSQ